MSRLPARWGLGVIIGPTGAGKSRAIEQLRAAGMVWAPLEEEHWPADQAIISAIASSPLVQGAAVGGMDAFLGSKPSEDKCADLAIERLSVRPAPRIPRAAPRAPQPRPPAGSSAPSPACWRAVGWA